MVKIREPLGSHDASGTLRAPPIYSKSFINRQARKPPPAPTPAAPDFIITGTVTPDCTGDYFYAGDYGGMPSYKRQDSAYSLWGTFRPPPIFFLLLISTTLTPPTDPWWAKGLSPNFLGNYGPQLGAIGIATVSLPP